MSNNFPGVYFHKICGHIWKWSQKFHTILKSLFCQKSFPPVTVSHCWSHNLVLTSFLFLLFSQACAGRVAGDGEVQDKQCTGSQRYHKFLQARFHQYPSSRLCGDDQRCRRNCPAQGEEQQTDVCVVAGRDETSLPTLSLFQHKLYVSLGNCVVMVDPPTKDRLPLLNSVSLVHSFPGKVRFLRVFVCGFQICRCGRRWWSWPIQRWLVACDQNGCLFFSRFCSTLRPSLCLSGIHCVCPSVDRICCQEFLGAIQ